VQWLLDMSDISGLDMRNAENVMETNVIGRTPNSRFRWSTADATESIAEPRENVMGWLGDTYS
jgi:hypothetical protein